MNSNQTPDLPFKGGSLDFDLNRREFIKLVGGGIVLYFTIGEIPLLAQRRNLPTDFNAFLRIGEDGRISCFTGKIEMGQGVITSLAQMLADELDAPLDAVDMVLGDTDLCPWDMGTFGSMTTRFFGPALRAAGAEARSILLELAAERLKVPVPNLVAENGIVFARSNRNNSISYAALAKGKKIERHSTGKVGVKKPSEFKIIGKSVTRQDATEKITGKAKYAGDLRFPDMLYAKILRPPAHDAKLVDIDLSEAKQVEGTVVVQERDLVAVLHKYPDVAEKALSKIKSKYEKPASDLDEKTIFDHLLKVAPEGKVSSASGDVQKGKHESEASVEAIYYNDYVAHAPIEPHTAVVKIEGTKVTVWASTQTPFSAKEEVAKELGVPSEQVRVMPVFVGGGFGGKTRNLQIVETARLAKLTGKPVQVAWNRKEEFFFDAFRPAAIVKVNAGIKRSASISFWDYHVYFAGERGAQHFYDIPNSQTVVYNSSWVGAAGTHPFATGPWRAPGNNTNTFARESHIDLLAAKAEMDPVEFRLKNLSNPAMRRVLQTAAEKYGWKPAKAPSSRGVGVACGVDAGTLVAAIAEVQVEKASGNVLVKRVVCVQDMGLVINPEGATIQMEGCITMGLGYALFEQIRFKGKEILDQNFDTYEIPRFSWVPKIETIIIDNKESDPQGGGEPAIVTMGAVIANAIYDAVGVRMYHLPMTRERVKEALKKS